MRLIDADHLRKWIIANWGNGWDSKTVDDILDQMDREDTYYEDADIVDAAPIIHGHWERLYANNYKCSVCGSWWTDDGDTYLIEFNYCPNCGAKMDEGKEDE